MGRRYALVIAALGVMLLAAPAHALPGLEAGVRGTYWFPDLSGDIQTFEPGLTGTRFDIKNDLGVEDEDLWSGEAFVRFGHVTLRAAYTPVGFDGNKQLTRQIVFGGQTFNVSETVVSSLDMDMLDGEIQVDLLRPNLVAASFNLGLIVKVKYVDGQVELTSGGTTESRDFQAPVPMVGAAAGVGILKNFLRADVRAAGMGYEDNRLFEADAFASLVPFPFLRIQGGYRYIDLKIDDDEIVADLTLKGPYVGAQLSF